MTPPWLAESERLHARVRAFIDGRGGEGFDDLALDLARFQRAHIPTVARLWAAEGRDAEAPRLATQIPALPTEVFRLRRVAVHDPAQDEALFRTSGTTAEAPGEHPMRTTATYARGALRFGAAMLWPDAAALRFLGLVPPPPASPFSSLTFMLARFAEQLAQGTSWHVDATGAVDLEGLAAACRACRDEGRPALVAGTSFAFVHLEQAAHPADLALALPAGSRVMQTGGFKGRSQQVAPATLRAQIAARFALPESHVVAEYGMTELSSQLYESTLREAVLPGGRGRAAEGGERRYVAPRWLRVDAADPETLAVLPAGERGLARFVDLANVDSTVAVQTADEICVHADGTVELFGRAPGAAPRGCSLTMERLLS